MLVLAVALLAQRPTLDTAWELAAKGQTEKAIVLLEDLVRKETGNGDARLLLGTLLAANGNQDGALVELREAVRLLPNSAEAHNTLGEALRTAKETKQAQHEFERAVQINPKFAQAQCNLGMTLGEFEDYAGSAQHLDVAIKLMGQTEDAAMAHFYRAKVHSSEGRTAEAAAELRTAIRLKPDLAAAWSDLGQALKAQRDDVGAFDAFTRAAKLDPRDASAQARLGAEYLHRNQPHEAAIHLREALESDPKDQTALFNLQRALREDGQKEEEALAVKARLAEIIRNKDQSLQNDLNANRLNNEGVKLQQAGDVPGALEKYRAAHELKPDNSLFRFNFAVMLLRAGRWKQGLAELHECLVREPDNPKVKAVWEDALRQAPRGSWVEQAPRPAPGH
jgi:protein O-GlcNAc transferase